MRIALTDREADLMSVLWQHGPSTVGQVRDHLKDSLAYTTVLSLLRTLDAKGYVQREHVGRGHRYRAAIAQDAARRSALMHLAGKLFDGSVRVLMAHLAADRGLSEEDIRRIERLFEESKSKGKR
jgi:predicted transcriptional regulator